MKRTRLIQLNSRDIKTLRKRLYLEQERKCAILKKAICWEETSLDHKHKLKHQTPGPNGRGLIRGVLHLQANSFEGKVAKIYKRYGLHKMIPLPELLRNLADYLENPPCPPMYIHPKEKAQVKKLGKREYNQIVKFYKHKYPNRRYTPKYPKSGKLTKELQLIVYMMEGNDV